MKKNYFVLLFAIVTILSSSKGYSQDAYIGEIRMFAGTYAPSGWALCEGQLLSIPAYSAVYAVLGINYGGDGRTTFGLPDMRGRVVLGVSNSYSSGLSLYSEGAKGGSETQVLNVNQMPAHSHAITGLTNDQNVMFSSDEAVRTVPVAGDVPAAPKFGNGLGATPVKSYGPATNTVNGQTITSTVQVMPTGASQAIDIRQPYIAVRYIICLVGLFPPRS